MKFLPSLVLALSAFGWLQGVVSARKDDSKDMMPDEPVDPADLPNLAVVAEENGFDTLVAAAASSGLLLVLENLPGPFTVFAPTDEAFDGLPVGALDYMLSNVDALAQTLGYHTVNGNYKSSNLTDGLLLTSAIGEMLTVFTFLDGSVSIEGAAVSAVDLCASNGVIHALDQVLLPPNSMLPGNIVDMVVADPELSTLGTAVVAAGLDHALVSSILTVFAPTDGAFDALPGGILRYLLDNVDELTDVLLYHVAEGKKLSTSLMDGMKIEAVNGEDFYIGVDNVTVTINEDATVVAADTVALNGAIHKIDSVLIPPGFEAPDGIFEVAVEEELEYFIKAVDAAGLQGVLAGDIFTVFAPSNLAFKHLPKGALDYLFDNPDVLSDVLSYHVVAGETFSADLTNGTIPTVDGENSLTIEILGEVISVDGAYIIDHDITALNGVIHVINEVLIPPTVTLPDNTVDVILADPELSTLAAAVVAAGLDDDIIDATLTIFAPTDDAFAALPAGAVDYLLENMDELMDLLKKHLVHDFLLSTDLEDDSKIEAFNGEDLEVAIDLNGTVTIDDATVLAADITALNGVIHKIDTVLLPEDFSLPDNIYEVAVGEELTYFVAAVGAAGIGPAIVGDIFTVFAPSDRAFKHLSEGALEYLLANPTVLADVLSYHVVAGEMLAEDLTNGTLTTIDGENSLTIEILGEVTSVNGAYIIDHDITALNGVIHVINEVLIPPTVTLPMNTVEHIVADPELSTLAAAVVAAGLDDDIIDATLTIFAPTDDAFAALPAGAVDYLLENMDELMDLLKKHLVHDTILSTDLEDGMKIEAVNGEDLVVGINGTVTIDDATVLAADITALNGVIHKIDTVLLPEDFSLPDNIYEVAEEEELTYFVTAVDAAGLQGALADDIFTVFAPSNRAFEHLPEGALEYLLANPTVLAEVLSYHVVAGETLSADLSNGTLATIDGVNSLTIEIDGEVISVDGAHIIDHDNTALNGVIHVINAVLIPPTVTLPDNTVGLIVADPELSTLAAAVVAAGLAGDIVDATLTIFAPTDDAFAALPGGALDYLLENMDELMDLLKLHLVHDTILSTDLEDDTEIEAVNGEDLEVAIGVNGTVTINDAEVVEADITALNGVIHKIDAVLLPEDFDLPDDIYKVAADEDLDYFIKAVDAAGLQGALAGDIFTVFAPSNRAFEHLPQGASEYLFANPDVLAEVLSYHVVAGQTLSADLSNGTIASIDGVNSLTIEIVGEVISVDGAHIIDHDNTALNGVIHVINAVLIPPTVTLPGNIVEMVQADSELSTLAAALGAAGLVDDIPDEILTLFAPTDSAFSDLPAGAVSYLLANTDELTDLLLYHIADGEILSSDLEDGMEIEAINHEDLEVGINGGVVTINDATVVDADVFALNGVIHKVHSVLLPEGFSLPDNIYKVLGDAELDALVAAIGAAGLEEAITDDVVTVFAPSDDAFGALPSGTLDALLADMDALAAVLTYHVVAGQMFVDDLTDDSIPTLDGENSLAVEIADGVVTVNGASILYPDLAALNGVVHVIDTVLLPPDFSI